MRAVARIWTLRIGGVVVGTLILALAAAGVLAWRLSQGPVQLDFAARLIEDWANAGDGPTRLHIGRASLAWQAAAREDERALVVQVADVTATDTERQVVAALPRGAVTLGLAALLAGRIEPHEIILYGARVSLFRAEDGSVSLDLASLDLGSLGEAIEPAGQAPDTPNVARERAAWDLLARLGVGEDADHRAPFVALERVRIAEARMVVRDSQLRADWRIEDARIDLTRLIAANGRPAGIDVAIVGTATAGPARTALRARGRLNPDGSGQIRAGFDPVAPALVAAGLPGLAVLSALDAPVSASITLDLGPRLAPGAARIEAAVATGRITLPDGFSLPLTSAVIEASADAGRFTLTRGVLVLPGGAGPSPTILLTGAAIARGGGYAMTAEATLDRVAVADVKRFWPDQVGRNPRKWIIANVTDGQVHDLAVRLTADLSADLSDIVPTGLAGGVRGEALTVHFLRPMPPIVGAAAEVIFGLDEIGITTRGGHVEGLAGIEAERALIRISGLNEKDQDLEVEARINAPLDQTMTLLKHPKLKLFGKRGAPPEGIGGRGQVDLVIGFPLLDNLDVDDVKAKVRARLADATAADIVLGKAITAGSFDLTADETYLTIEGEGRLGGVAVRRLRYEADFKAGAANQVTERAFASIAPTEGLATAFDFDLAPYVTGPIGAEATVTLRRDGQGVVELRGELGRARIAVAELGYMKPAGAPATVEATLRLNGTKLASVDVTRVSGPDLSGRARIAFLPSGQVSRIEVPDLALGVSRVTADIRAPGRPGAPWVIEASGPMLDLSAEVEGEVRAAPQADRGPRPPIEARVRLDALRIAASPAPVLDGLTLSVALDQRGQPRRLEARGRVGDRGSFSARVNEADGAASLEADDAGALLHALGVVDTMAGGVLSITGRFDGTQPSRPLVAEAVLTDFRLREAPVLARLLQAMTLYGVLDLMRGSGLSFTRMVAPFTLDGEVLTLREARAFSSSLGLTAGGPIDLEARSFDLRGTIVPAYFFNSLLGNLPLIGRLFSPERGGGLFAANFTVRGPFAEPAVSVNPLSVLTPGFLRGIFGGQDRTVAGPAAPLATQSPATTRSAPATQPRPSRAGRPRVAEGDWNSGPATGGGN